MDLDAGVLGELQYMRDSIEALMRDTVRIERKTGQSDPDPDTLEVTDTWELIHEGKARVQRPGRSDETDRIAGDHQFGISQPDVQLPITVTGPAKDDRVTVIAIGPHTDPELLGAVMTVIYIPRKSHATKRVLQCAEVTT